MITLKKYRTDWEYKRLQFGANILNSNVDKKVIEGEIPVKLCNYVDVYYNDIINENLDFMEGSATEGEIEKFKIVAGDVIITKDSESANDIGIPAYVEKSLENVVCGYHLAIFKPFKEKLNGKFLLYFLNSKVARTNFELGSNGVTRFGLSRNAIKILPVPYPKVTEQTLIARFLDQKTGQIDRLIEQKEKLLKLLAEKRTAIITRAVTKGLPAEERAKAGLDPNVEMKDSGIDWLGEIPKHWEILKLKYLGRMKSGEGITTLEMNEDNEYPVYGGNGFRGYSSAFTHDGDYILIGRQGALCGNINYASGKFWASEHAVVLTRTENIDFIWMGELLRIMNLNQYSISAAQPGLAIDRIQNLEVPLPPFSEQQDISKYLEKFNSNSLVDVKIKDSIQKLKEYREALITSAVTGQIDVRKEVIHE